MVASWLGTAVLVGARWPLARVFESHDAAGASVLALALAAFAPGLVGYGISANLSRVLYARGRNRATALAIGGGWLLVIAADLVIVPFVPPRHVVPALGLGMSFGLTVSGLALLILVARDRGALALHGVPRAFLAGLAGRGGRARRSASVLAGALALRPGSSSTSDFGAGDGGGHRRVRRPSRAASTSATSEPRWPASVPAPASPAPPPPAAPAGQVGQVGRSAGSRWSSGRRRAGPGRTSGCSRPGLAGRGIGVSVLGPPSADAAFGFGALTGVMFSPVEIGGRPRPGDVAAVLRLRGGCSVPAPDVVHAHGLRAGALAAIALGGSAHAGHPPGGDRGSWSPSITRRRPAGEPGCWSTACSSASSPAARTWCCASRPTSRRACDCGARGSAGDRVRPRYRPQHPTAPRHPSNPDTRHSPSFARRLDGRGPRGGAAGRSRKDFGTLLAAAARWRDLDPEPQVAIAGEGPLAADLRAQADLARRRRGVPRTPDDVPDLLAAAAVFVLPSRWEGQPLILQEALRAGAAIVATRVGGIPDLVGDDAAVLVRPGDPQALAAAVRAVLTDPPLAARLRAAAVARGGTLPTAADAVAAALAAYAEALAAA